MKTGVTYTAVWEMDHEAGTVESMRAHAEVVEF